MASFFEDAYIIFEQRQQQLLSDHNFVKTYATLIVDLVKHTNAGSDDAITQRRLRLSPCTNCVEGISLFDLDPAAPIILLG